MREFSRLLGSEQYGACDDPVSGMALRNAKK